MMRRYAVAPLWSRSSSAYDVALDVLLTVALLLSTASQLRFVGVPVGPGEICLCLWGLLMLSREVARLGPVLSGPLSRLLAFWLSFAIAQCVGTMTGFVTGDRHDLGLFMHDIAAYVVVAAVSCLSVVEPGAGSRLHRVAWLLVTCGAAWLLLQAAFGWGLVNLGDFDTWEWDRFRGLSDNSNQLALFCTVLVLLSLYLAEVAKRFDGSIVALICMIVAIVVGRLTKSDAFLLVLVLGGPIFVTLKLRKWLMSVERRMLLRSASAWILVLALPLAAAYVTPLGASVAVEVEESIKSMTKGGGGRDTEETTRLRIELWGAAIRRGIEAGMLGLGPGPHLEIPPAIAAGRLDSTNDPNVKHPEVGDVPNFEAHNTFLDLFLQGGLIAVLSIGWLGATALSGTRRAGLDALTTSICGLAVFGVFHLIVRHPIFWFAISLSLVAASNSRRASKCRAES